MTSQLIQKLLYARSTEVFSRLNQDWLIWLPVCLAVGIGTYFGLPEEPSRLIAYGSFTGSLLVAIAAKFRSRSSPIIRTLLGATLFISLGFAAATHEAHRVSGPVLKDIKRPIDFTGTVVSIEPSAGTHYRMTIAPAMMSRLDPTDYPKTVRVTVRTKGDVVYPGDMVSLTARLQAPSGPVIPGGFDFAQRAWFSSLGAIGYAISPVTLVDEGKPEDLDFSINVARARVQLIHHLSKQVDSEAGLMAVALMTGARSILKEETREDMRAAGLAHLLAISGLHIGLVAGSVLLLFRGLFALIPGLALRYPIKKIAAVLALLAAFFYLLLSGATIPTQRAFAMTGIVLLAIMLDRLAITMRMVAVVAAVLLLFSPHMLLNVSFQMSFAAVISLVAFYEALRGKSFLVNWRKSAIQSTGVYLGGVAATSLIAGFSTGFIAAYHFNMFANYGLVANMVAVPVMSLWVMPMALLTFALMPFGLESWGLAAMTWGNNVILWSAASVHDWPASVWLLPALPMEAFVIACIGGVWWCLWRRRSRHLGAILVCTGCLGWLTTTPPDILVDGDAKVFGIRLLDGDLVLSSRQSGRRAGATWLEHLGRQQARRIIDYNGEDHEHPELMCDNIGCIFRPASSPITASVLTSPLAIAEDCGKADIVISLVPLGWHCKTAPPTVDRFDLWREGAHAIWLRDKGPEIRTAAQIQGRRLWSSFPSNRLTDHSVLSN